MLFANIHMLGGCYGKQVCYTVWRLKGGTEFNLMLQRHSWKFISQGLNVTWLELVAFDGLLFHLFMFIVLVFPAKMLLKLQKKAEKFSHYRLQLRSVLLRMMEFVSIY